MRFARLKFALPSRTGHGGSIAIDDDVITPVFSPYSGGSSLSVKEVLVVPKRAAAFSPVRLRDALSRHRR
jgi:hypothetical protein